jgi:hypothetical protein
MSDVTYLVRPLGQWIDPETPVRRSAHVFKATWRDTLAFLGDEIEKIGGKSPVVFQIDVQESDIRLDGMLRANAKVGHPGVVISFESKYGPLRYATDAYEQQYYGGMPSWQANIRAIALALQALRAVDRYGVTRRGEQYVGWRAITAGGATFASADEALRWMAKYAADELGLVLAADITPKALYRAMAMKMHPDQGHPRADWDRLDDARRMLAEAGRM